MQVGEKLAPRSLVRLPLKGNNTNLTCLCTQVKYFSPATHLCIIRVARGDAARTTWAALVLLDRIGNNEGHKFVPHVIHVSGAFTRHHTKTASRETPRF